MNELLREFPKLKVAYAEEGKVAGKRTFYSCLIDSCVEAPGTESSSRTFASCLEKPNYRVKLPGHPIVGDGKGDNQNHALVFCHGEILQCIDMNQDSYAETAGCGVWLARRAPRRRSSSLYTSRGITL